MSNRQVEQNEKMVDFYIEEDRREDVKDCFKFLKSILEQRFGKEMDGVKLCDVGCATGDLLWYLSGCFNGQKFEFSGIDVDKTLLDIARKRMPFVDFVECDIMNATDFPKKYDIVTCFGVLSLFEDYKKFISRICDLSVGGRCYIFVPFNPYGYSVKYEYTYFENDVKFLEYVPSIQAVDQWIKEKGWSCEWHRFDISVDIPKREKSYPLRAWTETLPNGRKMIRDGIERIQDQYILEIIVE